MIDAPIALAFTAGMVASVNPCGFAMLPAYVSYFVGTEGDTPLSAPRRAQRALLTAGVVSIGFLLVFGVVGAVVTVGIRSVIDYVPWISIGIGAVLVALGIAMLFGYRLKIVMPQVERGGDSRRVKSIFLFGISYAIASLSCTLPVFLAIVSGTVTRTNFASGMAAFVAYAAGMSVILFTLTLAVAAANQAVVGALRRASHYVDRAAGVLLIIAGTYIVYYWTWFKVTDVASTTGDGPIRVVTDLSTSATRFIAANQTSIVVVFFVMIAAALALVFSGRSRQTGHEQMEQPTESGPSQAETELPIS